MKAPRAIYKPKKQRTGKGGTLSIRGGPCSWRRPSLGRLEGEGLEALLTWITGGERNFPWFSSFLENAGLCLCMLFSPRLSNFLWEFGEIFGVVTGVSLGRLSGETWRLLSLRISIALASFIMASASGSSPLATSRLYLAQLDRSSKTSQSCLDDVVLAQSWGSPFPLGQGGQVSCGEADAMFGDCSGSTVRLFGLSDGDWCSSSFLFELCDLSSVLFI